MFKDTNRIPGSLTKIIGIRVTRFVAHYILSLCFWNGIELFRMCAIDVVKKIRNPLCYRRYLWSWFVLFYFTNAHYSSRLSGYVILRKQGIDNSLWVPFLGVDIWNIEQEIWRISLLILFKGTGFCTSDTFCLHIICSSFYISEEPICIWLHPMHITDIKLVSHESLLSIEKFRTRL